jgi:hypothetical protein
MRPLQYLEIHCLQSTIHPAQNQGLSVLAPWCYTTLHGCAGTTVTVRNLSQPEHRTLMLLAIEILTTHSRARWAKEIHIL